MYSVISVENNDGIKFQKTYVRFVGHSIVLFGYGFHGATIIFDGDIRQFSISYSGIRSYVNVIFATKIIWPVEEKQSEIES